MLQPKFINFISSLVLFSLKHAFLSVCLSAYLRRLDSTLKRTLSHQSLRCGHKLCPYLCLFTESFLWCFKGHLCPITHLGQSRSHHEVSVPVLSACVRACVCACVRACMRVCLPLMQVLGINGCLLWVFIHDDLAQFFLGGINNKLRLALRGLSVWK